MYDNYTQNTNMSNPLSDSPSNSTGLPELIRI